MAREKVWGHATLYELQDCPWNPEHQRTARIVRFDNGALSAACFHASCHGKSWAELRNAVEGSDRRAYWNKELEEEAASSVSSPRIVRLADVAPEAVHWLWRGYVPYRKVTLLAGDPGLGKS